MEYWNRLVAFLSQRMDSFGISAADIPVPLVLAALLFPLLLTALARQPLAFFSVLLVICGLLVVDPATAQAGVLVATGAYVSSILVGVIAIQWSIRNRRISAEMARLRASVEHLRRIVEQEMTTPAAVVATQPTTHAPAAASPSVAAPVPATTAAVAVPVVTAPAIVEARTEPQTPPAPMPVAPTVHSSLGTPLSASVGMAPVAAHPGTLPTAPVFPATPGEVVPQAAPPASTTTVAAHEPHPETRMPPALEPTESKRDVPTQELDANAPEPDKSQDSAHANERPPQKA